MSYIGRVRPTETTSSVLRSTYTGNGSTTTYALPGPVANETSIIATINGVTQQDAAYSTDGTNIIFAAAPALGDSIELRTLSAVAMSYAPSAGSVVTGVIADGAITAQKLASGVAVANIGSREITAGQVPAGSVIQVLNTTTTTLVTNSTSTYTSTGLSLNITPKFSTSKILVMAWCPIRYGTNNGGGNVGIRINRASGTILMNNNLINNVSAIVDISYPITLSYLDSPATTSSTNYTIEFALVNSSGVYTNPTVNWNSGITQTSTLTLMEIAA